MSGFEPSEDRLLRAVVPPPLSSGFADRVMAAVPSRVAPHKARRERRGGWKRGRVAVIGAVTAGLLSVGAAASGLLGGRVQQLPVIATIAEAVQAKPAAPAPVIKRVAVTPKVSIAPKRESVAPLTTPDAARAQRLAQRIARRNDWRAARGLPPIDLRARQAARERIRQMLPEERREVIERIRESRAERAAIRPEIRAERRARWLEMRENLTPEQRARLREWRQRRRAITEEIEPPPAE